MKTTAKKTRGIRRPDPYAPGRIAKNLHVARTAVVKGDRLVSEGAARFISNVQMFSEIIGLTVNSERERIEFEIDGAHRQAIKARQVRKRDGKILKAWRNVSWMKFLKLKEKDIARNAHWLAIEICARILWAIKNKTGVFFDDLARLCESPEEKMTVMEYLILAHWDLSKGTQDGRKQDHRHYVSELKKQLTARLGTSIEERDIYPLLKKIGAEYRPAKHRLK